MSVTVVRPLFSFMVELGLLDFCTFGLLDSWTLGPWTLGLLGTLALELLHSWTLLALGPLILQFSCHFAAEALWPNG